MCSRASALPQLRHAVFLFFTLEKGKEKRKERKSKVKKRKTAWRSWGRADAREHIV
jgi:hypothetical protein